MASRTFSLGLILVVAATATISSPLNLTAAASSLPLDSQAQIQLAPSTPPVETSLLKPGAVVKFIGVKHGLSDAQQARSAFEQKVQLVIGQPLTIDLFDPMTNDGTSGSGLIEWHSLGMIDCNEETIRQLLAKFKNPDAKGWTREFKMEFGPDFDMPERVEFEWRNACAANYQKRTLDAASSTTSTPTTTSAPTTTSTPETATNPPEAPSTTTEAPMTTPELLATTSEKPDSTSWNLFADVGNSSETLTNPSSETTTSGFSMLSMTDFSSTLAPNVTTTSAAAAAATTTTTTATSAEVNSTTRETSTSETLTTSPEMLATTTTTTTTVAPTTPSEVPEATLKTPTSTAEIPAEDLSGAPDFESENESLIDSATSTATPLAEETPAQNSSSGSSSPHYGKYIGLTTGFFVFIAYLLCARAYRRQGMYELHEST